MRYQNEPCCGCEEPLAPEADDIVVCPDCGAPMHRTCWQKASACPLRAQHSAEFSWQPTQKEEEPEAELGDDEPLDIRFDEETEAGVICPVCGGNCPPGTNTCPNCGEHFSEFAERARARYEEEARQREQQLKDNFPTYTVHGRTVTMGDIVAEQPLEEIALQLRGSRSSVTHYLERFEDNKKISWNWAAFFMGLFGPFWFFFRKLYQPGIAFGVVVLIATLAFLPTTNKIVTELNDRYQPIAEQLTQSVKDAGNEEVEAALTAAQKKLTQAAKDVLWKHRMVLSLLAVQALLLAVLQGLFADILLRRQIWANITLARAESGGQRFVLHQALVRMGGFSLFAPMAWFLGRYLILQTIINFVTTLTN